MSWMDFWDRKVKQFSIWDVKVAQIWTAGWVLILIKIFPQIIELSVWWFVGVLVLCLPRLVYIVWLRPES